jgi:hypothetical protein
MTGQRHQAGYFWARQQRPSEVRQNPPDAPTSRLVNVKICGIYNPHIFTLTAPVSTLASVLVADIS